MNHLITRGSGLRRRGMNDRLLRTPRELLSESPFWQHAITWRRWMQFTEILDGGERGSDTTDWVNNTLTLEHGICSPLLYFEEDTSIWMKPVRCSLVETTQTPISGVPYPRGHAVYDERCLDVLTGSTINSKHTYSIMAHGGAGVPSSSHLQQMKLTEWSLVPPAWQSWWDVPVNRFPPVPVGEVNTTPYRGYLEAYRLWIDGVDFTGIVTLDSSIGFWQRNQLEHSRSDGGFYLDTFIGESALSKLLSSSSTFDLDLWFRLDMQGWLPIMGEDYPPPEGNVDGNDAFPSYGYVWVPTVKLGIGGDYGLYSTYGGLGNSNTNVGNANQRLLCPRYYFDLQLTGVAKKMPTGWPWTLTLEESSWTPGGVTEFDLNTPPVASSYPWYQRPSGSVIPTPALIWDTTTYSNVDDFIIAPAAGDGLTIKHGPHSDSANWSASALFNLTAAGVNSDPVTFVKVWVRGRCNSGETGKITGVAIRFSVSGVLQTRTASTSAFTADWEWHSFTFIASEVAGATAMSQVRLDATLTDSSGFVEVEAIYVETFKSGDWIVSKGETTLYAQHDNGDAISFQFGREVPEFILKRAGNLYSSSGVLIQASEMSCLYRPADNDSYQSDVAAAPGVSAIEPAGTWNPNADTVFKLCGYNPGPRSFEGVTNTSIPTTGTMGAIYSVFPATITLVRN